MDGWNKQAMAEGPLGAFPQLPGLGGFSEGFGSELG